MRYHSTRGADRGRSFTDILLAGLAADGGLFLPDRWPAVSKESIAGMGDHPYARVTADLIHLFAGDAVPADRLREMCDDSYARFGHEDVAPLIEIGPDAWVLELFHGPTLAFKDFAMQLLGRLFEFTLTNEGKRLTIIGATSGDTGGAAIEALKGLSSVDVFILHPEGGVSDVQRRMMTTVCEANVHNIAVQGSFDDCQNLVKNLFRDADFRDRVDMGAINSINWARIIAQTAYYFTSAAALGAPERRLSYVVPTGNFGDIFAGYVASRMGLPVGTLCIATNSNDLLRRCLETGIYAPDTVHRTMSPSMDIQVSSNFERLLFEVCDRDHEMVAEMMHDLDRTGRFTIPEAPLKRIRDKFTAFSASEAETADKMREMYERQNYLIDPHTATGLVALQKARKAGWIEGGAVALSTAHPAKFPDAVKKATGVDPALPLCFADLFDRKEEYAVLPNDPAMIKAHVLSALGRT